MNEMLKNNKGITLIEVLAVLALLSMVLLLASSFNLFGHKQLTNQSSHINNEENLRLALNIITKDIRSANIVEVCKSSEVDKFLKGDLFKCTGNDAPISERRLVIDTNVYKFSDQTIFKNNSPVISDISEFTVTKNENRIFIELVSIKAKNGKTSTLSTDIYLRE